MKEAYKKWETTHLNIAIQNLNSEIKKEIKKNIKNKKVIWVVDFKDHFID